jgi:nicotinamidase-related amidase
MVSVNAEPYDFEFDPKTTALVMIDFQRDFVYPGGFGESLGNDTSFLLKALPPAGKVLAACRAAGIYVIHTREGHRPDLSDLPRAKYERGNPSIHIGDEGPMGRLLIRGSYGHDIVEEVYPIEGEPIVDKPGKGAFYATDMGAILRTRGIEKLVFCGVTTEVCVQTSVREANDRGYDSLVLSDCVGSYFPEFQKAALDMIKAQGGIFGWVSDSTRFLEALRTSPETETETESETAMAAGA